MHGKKVSGFSAFDSSENSSENSGKILGKSEEKRRGGNFDWFVKTGRGFSVTKNSKNI